MIVDPHPEVHCAAMPRRITLRCEGKARASKGLAEVSQRVLTLFLVCPISPPDGVWKGGTGVASLSSSPDHEQRLRSSVKAADDPGSRKNAPWTLRSERGTPPATILSEDSWQVQTSRAKTAAFPVRLSADHPHPFPCMLAEGRDGNRPSTFPLARPATLIVERPPHPPFGHLLPPAGEGESVFALAPSGRGSAKRG